MERLRVLTLNIWNRQGPWDSRVTLIRDQLAELAPDVVGFQEVLALGGQSQAHELVAPLGWHVFHATAWDMGGGLAFGNAIASRFPLVRSEVLALPTTTELETRSVAHAVVDAPCGHVPVFCTHLTYQQHRSDMRCAQVRALADHVDRLCPSSDVGAFPPVIVGDFNANPDADEMRFLRGLTPLAGRSVFFADAWDATAGDNPERGAGYTYARRNPYALRSREPNRRIDYVLVRGPDRALRGEPLAAQVVMDAPGGADGGVWPSDHFGVLAEIQAAARPHDPY